MNLILGIDPGSSITGYAVLEGGNAPHLRDAGCIRLPRAAFAVRLGLIFQNLSDIIREHEPDVMAVEDVFVSRNAASALKLGQARGAAICAGAAASLPVSEYTPTQIKNAIVGRGRADKRQMQHMVGVLLGISKHLQADAADAAAVALCHAHHSRTAARMRSAGVELKT
ncbi:MAG TPA: crossover junction endodeoxyribonuclease RuvC [Salinisphaeraceae bacterium]|nr:crossover junction endodeoxyribonuclease RuvC [Salinisphaeraceae bacterium]